MQIWGEDIARKTETQRILLWIMMLVQKAGRKKREKKVEIANTSMYRGLLLAFLQFSSFRFVSFDLFFLFHTEMIMIICIYMFIDNEYLIFI